MARSIAALLVLFAAAPALAEEPARLVAATWTHEERTPRQLFNAGLRAEERRELARACELYLAARLSPRVGVADHLYARGAALRLVRILAGRDDDAALAAAVLVEDRGESSDLGPLVRSLLRRYAGAGGELADVQATLVAARFDRASAHVVLELELEDGETRVVLADGGVAPISPGQELRALLKRTRGKAAAGWTVIALGPKGGDGWRILRVEGLPTKD